MRIHFIGICGVAMSALAIALREAGHTITGSDKGFYPPVSDNLRKNNINFYPGWHPDKMTAHGAPDLVVVGNVAGSTNPEWVYVQENNIPYKSYPEVVREFIIKKNSIVCAGTYGKSTTTTLLAWVLSETGYDPSYMFGGICVNHIPPATITDTDWSIVEGDEYKSARWDDKAKFYHYAPTHLLLTAVEWDHADVYPTEQRYTEAFQDLVNLVPTDGTIVVSERVQSLTMGRPVVCYGADAANDYQYTDITASTSGVMFSLHHSDDVFSISSPLIGRHNVDNLTAVFAMAHQIGIAPKNIIPALQSFQGIKRRLEKRASGDVTVFDDIAHSPAKAAATLKTLREVYSGHITAVFEPNTGNRQTESIPQYEQAFTDADTVIIPRLSAIKKDPKKPDALDGQSLADVLKKTHTDVRYIADDQTLVGTLNSGAKKDDVIVFLGSHGFRGMIESVIDRLG